MRQLMVRYRVKPEQAEQNEALVQRVFEELQETAPAGIHYATFVMEDGVSFVHVLTETDEAQTSLPDVAAFREFQANIAERCDEPPAPAGLREIGSYGFWAK